MRSRRTELGLAQMALADRVGLHFTLVSEVERGVRNVSLATLLRLARGLEVDPGALVEGLCWRETYDTGQLGRPWRRDDSRLVVSGVLAF